MAILDNAVWLSATTGNAVNGTHVVTDGANSTTVTGTFTANTFNATQGGYNISEFGAFGVTTPATIDYGFSNDIENLSFQFQHVNDDGASTYDDKWTIRVYDTNGVLIPASVVISAFSGLQDEVVYANPDGSVTLEARGTIANNVTFNLTGYDISAMSLTFSPGPGGTQTGGSGISDLTFSVPTPPDGTVEGTAGNDIINSSYVGDPEGDRIDNNDAILSGHAANDDLVYGFGGDDSISAGNGRDTVYGGTGNDTIDGGAGNDTIDGGGGNDTIDGGTDSDVIQGGFGNDSVAGGTGNDILYGDSTAAPVTGSSTSFSWARQGVADEASVTGGVTGLSANGNVRVTMSVQQEANFGTATMETNDPLYNFNTASDTSSIFLSGGNLTTGGSNASNQNSLTATIDFSSGASGYSDEVSNVTFGIFDIDELQGQFLDQVIVTAYDANGNSIPVTVTLGSTTTLTSTTNANGSQTVTSIVNTGGAGASDSQTGYASFSVAGPVSYITIDYNNMDPAYGAHGILVGDLQFTSLPATGGNDTLNGGAGNDTIFGQDGNDTLDGGTGNDTLYGGLGNDIMQGGADSDSMYGGDGNDSIADSGTTSDYIEGGAGNDYITSGAGADTVYGGTGADSLFGNDGNDTLYGDDGDDYVDGDGGSDKLYGGIGNDVIVGDDGNDSMYGGTGNDQIYASSGENYVEGGDGNDSIYMGTGNDTIYGGLNEDVLYGGAGNDLISGDSGNDTLFGDAGNDTLTGGAGNDSITGGAGSDRIVLGNAFGTDTINGSEDAGNTDVDILDASAVTTATTVTMSGPEAGTLTTGTSTATFQNIEGIVTGSGADSIIGSSGNDTITTGAGADRVNMGAGNDTINLGAGTATDGAADVVVLQDGSGNDIINGFDAPTANGDGTFTGVDKLDVSALYDLPAGDPLRTPVRTNDVVVTNDGAGNAVLTFPNGESVTLIGVSPTTANNPFYLNAMGIPMGDGTVEGSAGDDLINGSYMGDPDGDRVDANDAMLAGDTGNDDLIYGFGGNDTIVANLGNDEVYGGTGNDSISGGAGFDTIYGDDGNDTINGGDDNDMLFGGIGDDKIEGDLGDDMLLGDAGNDSMAGGAGNDHLVGGDGNDLMNGGADNDLMYGGFNNDTLSGDAGNDTLHGDQGDDILYGGAGNDTLFGGDDNDVLDGGDNNDYVAGGNGNDTLYGGLGNDSLVGGAGNDTLYAGGGDDALVGSSGDDTFVITDGWGNDTIEGSETLETNGDTLDLSAVTTNLTVNLTSANNESGSVTDGLGNAATFVEIENIILGGGNDTIVLNDTTGDYTVQQFEAPTPNGDGTFTGVDVLNVTGLHDAQNNPVNVNDVIVTDDGSGNAVLNFPNGQSLTLIGISPTEADNPLYLNAIGIPLSDGTVTGTTGDDVINASYTGDPDGDMVDGSDAILAGHTGNDDLIEAGAGNDIINSGAGNDTIYAGADNDTVHAGIGNDTIFGEAGNDWLVGEAGDDLIYGGDGDDLLFGFENNDTLDGGTGNDIINGGEGNDVLAGGEGADRFVLEASFGNDTITGGETGLDNDTIWSTQGVDTVTTFTGNEAGTITDGSSTATFSEIEVLNLGGGNDVVDASAANSAVTVYGGAGSDVVTGSSAADVIYGGDDGDTITGGAGADSMYGGNGDDWFMIEDGFGNDTIVGGEGSELTGDYILGAGLTGDVTLDLTAGSASNAEDGTLTMGGDTVNFSEIEVVILGSGNDTVIGSSGNEMVATGGGADTVNGGAGDDIFDIGSGDGASDLIILQDDFGNDTIYSFEAPTPNGDGTFTGTDMLDVTALYDKPASDPSRTPVYTNDVTVTDDGMGNAVLSFPNGETLTLVGISPTDAANPFFLNAIGIPLSDGTVEGTAGDDYIDSNYTGDPDGDKVDGNDAILSGDTGNDDLIYGYGGNDSIYAGNGNDEVYGGTGNDLLQTGLGDDTVYGDDGNDSIYAENGNDTVYGGAGDDVVGASIGNDLVYGGDGNDTISGGGYSYEGDTLFGDAGNDSISGGNGTDTLYGGADDDILVGGADNDSIYGGTGSDTIDGGAGDDILRGGGDGDTFIIEDNFGNDTIQGGETVTTGTEFDTIDLSAVTTGVTVDWTTSEAGTIVSGADTITFSQIEQIILTDLADSVDASAETVAINIDGAGGNDTIIDGLGSDTIFGGSGNDFIQASFGNDSVSGGAGDDSIAAFFGHNTLSGGDGNDVIYTGSGDDVLMGGDGNDVISGGDGSDNLSGGGDADTFLIEDGFGNDTVTGGETATTGTDFDTIDLSATGGTNVLLTGNEAGTYDFNNSAATGSFSEIESFDLTDSADTFDGSAATSSTTVLAGAGNDTITTGSGNDSILAGAGDDLIDGGAGDDSIDGGTGNDTFAIAETSGADTIVGGENAGDTDTLSFQGATFGAGANVTFTGDESGTYLVDGSSVAGPDATGSFSEIEAIVGTETSDYVNASASAAAVTISGEGGFDILTGGSADDVIYGGDGGDLLTGGEGADVLIGDAGNDVITFSEGDTVEGGTGDDTFIAEDLGETSNGTITITGGNDAETGFGDTLQLGDLADMSTLVKISDGINASGNETFHGSVTMDDGTILNFSEIENIICFTPGTRIATPKGARDIATLRVGDLVVTRDHGLQPIRWIQQRTVPAMENFAPIRIRPGVVVGQDRDLLVSPQHRMLFQGYRAELLFGESEVLVSAKHLLDGKLVTQEAGGNVTYIHMMFDEHEVVYAEGAATESFHPGDVGLTAISDPAREELFALFPELRTNVNGYGQTARRCLKKHEIELLVR